MKRTWAAVAATIAYTSHFAVAQSAAPAFNLTAERRACDDHAAPVVYQGLVISRPSRLS
jgi:hypothetical protein